MKPKPVSSVGRKKPGAEMPLKWILPAAGVAVLIMGIWIGVFWGNREDAARSTMATPQVFGVATVEVAKQFACPCGKCGEENLAVCECPTAVSAKRFIETNLHEGRPKKEVINIVKDMYGHFKG